MPRTLLFQKLIYALQQARRENLKAEGKPLPLTKEQYKWTRRRLLRYATLAGGAAVATSTLSRAAGAQNKSRQPTIAIVGGGIAGLNAAYQLKKAGIKATVYEASGRLGGRIQSFTGVVGTGLVTDLGGSLINSEHEDILTLAREFGLKLFDRNQDAERSPFPAVGYFFDGKIRSEGEIANLLRSLAQQISQDAALIDEDFERFAPKFDRLSVAQYLDKHADKIPEPYIRELIEASIRTEYGVEAKDSSLLQLLFNLPTVDGQQVEVLGNSDEAFVFQEGSGKIIDQLASTLSDRIYTAKKLTKIQSQSRGFCLTFNNNYEVNADYVIIAIPFQVLRNVDLQVNLKPKFRRFINEVNLGSNEKLISGFDKKIWRQATGFVAEIWTDLEFSEAWDETQRQTDRTDGALTFLCGGDRVKAIRSRSPQSVGKEFVNQFDSIIPGAKNAANNKFLLTQWYKDPFIKGAYTNFKPGQLTEFGEFLYIESDDPQERQDVNVGNLVFAGEHLSDEFYGFMNGAAQTGRLAAELVVRKISAKV
ncbi:flavin monoamine oxidase family protein [Aliterella atlantica]|uniref:Monoamine oxidase n=1 Tax=Aliterella atlantica CENA595 TaxID=1618023 RepID=A0A0D9A0J9_9CYAN|nr:NAD(P)/FAD-dependent oxidoreductase [Aliterella atlantica]KJH73001.1 monoamine oxidase [Aliterella atlantica CENA595]